MLGAAAVAGAIAKRHGHGWDDIQKATGEKLASVLPAILILLSIGMLIGTWVLSGTIPFLVYWGIELVSPRYLVVTAFLATCVMSLATGTSWGSAGTIGVALMGMAAATGAPLPLVAGAVVSGAYFGDKMSPLSDSTNISAIGAGADLYAHIRHMIYTALPSFVLSLAVYLIFGSGAAGSGPAVPESARRLLMDIDTVYGLGVLALLPPAIVVIGIARRTPAALAIAASSAVAGVVGVAVQHFTVQNALVAAVSGFDTGMLRSLGLDPSSVGANFTTLVSRGGLSSMVGTLLVVIAAFLLAGAMDVSGALETLINAMLRSVRSVFGLIASTMAAGATMISLTSHGGVTALVIGGLFQKAYDSAGTGAPESVAFDRGFRHHHRAADAVDGFRGLHGDDTRRTDALVPAVGCLLLRRPDLLIVDRRTLQSNRLRHPEGRAGRRSAGSREGRSRLSRS